MQTSIIALTFSPVWTDMFSLGLSPAEKILRTVAVYLFIAVLIRVAGKRLMAQMNSLDLVVLLLLSNVVQNAVIGNDNSLLGGLLGATVLVGFNAGLDRAAHRWQWVRRVAEGVPSVLVRDGVADEVALARLGISPGELASAMRRQGADALAEVQQAVLEPGGAITVDLRPEQQNASAGQVQETLRQIEESLAQLRSDLQSPPQDTDQGKAP